MRRSVGRLLAAGLSLALLLSGCWSRVEINDLALVTEAGMDIEESGNLSLSINVLTTSGGGGGGVGGMGGGESRQRRPQVITVSSEGRDVMDAVSKLQQKIPRRLFWAHFRTLVLGEELAHHGVRQYLDYWMRQPEPRLTLQVVVARGRAEQLLKVHPDLRRFLAESIDEINRSRIGLLTTLRDFATDLAGGSRDPAAPFYEVRPAGSDEGTEAPELRLAGAAVFRSDRMVAVVDPVEYPGFVWLRRAPQDATVTVELPGHRLVSARLFRASSSLSARQSGQATLVTIATQAFLDVFETAPEIDISDPGTYERVRGLLERELEQQIGSAYSLVARDLRVDPMGVGQRLRSSDPARWQRLKSSYHDLLPGTKLEVKATVHLERSSMQGKTGTLPGDGGFSQ